MLAEVRSFEDSKAAVLLTEAVFALVDEAASYTA
jgi:hypothetical protein